MRQSGRILMVDNNGSGAVMLRPIMHYFVEIRFKLDVHQPTRIVANMCTKVQLLHNSTSTGLPEIKWSVSRVVAISNKNCVICA